MNTTTELAWFYDICVVVIMIVCMYFGSKRGFLVTLVKAVSIVIAVVAASTLGNAWAEPVYNSELKSMVTESIRSNIEQADIVDDLRGAVNEKYGVLSLTNKDIKAITDGDGDYITGISRIISRNSNKPEEEIRRDICELLGDRISSAFTLTLPSYMTDSAVKGRNATADTLNSTLKALLTSDEAAAEYIEATIVRSSVISMVRLALTLAIFIVLMIALSVVAGLLGFVKKLPLIGTTDSFFGMLLGAVQGIVIVYIGCLILHASISTSGDTLLVINTNTVDSTMLFRYIYYWNR